MYEKIMVPLDGSALAECVFPHVKAFMKGFRVGSIHLVRVLEPPSTRYDDSALVSGSNREKLSEFTRRVEELRKKAAAEYLEQAASRLMQSGVEIKTEVIFGSVADRLADYTENNGIDLIIIATHGRSGISRWVRGSVADRVLRFSHVPVLMVQAGSRAKGLKA